MAAIDLMELISGISSAVLRDGVPEGRLVELKLTEKVLAAPSTSTSAGLPAPFFSHHCRRAEPCDGKETTQVPDCSFFFGTPRDAADAE